MQEMINHGQRQKPWSFSDRKKRKKNEKNQNDITYKIRHAIEAQKRKTRTH
jgi:hypothetical protein